MLAIEFEPFSTGDIVKIALLSSALLLKCFFAGRMIGYGIANAQNPRRVRISLSILAAGIALAGLLLWIMVSPWLLTIIGGIGLSLTGGILLGKRMARLEQSRGPTR